MTVGQINLSRENRFLSNAVNCTELEREKCYFSSMKGKQDLSLFTLSSPFQKKVNLIPSLKKIEVLFIRRHLVPFRLEITYWSSVPFLFDLRHMRQGWVLWCSGDVKRVGTQSGDVGLFAIVNPVNHSNHWAWDIELMNWSPLYSRLHTYSVLSFYLSYHNLWTWIIF